MMETLVAINPGGTFWKASGWSGSAWSGQWLMMFKIRETLGSNRNEPQRTGGCRRRIYNRTSETDFRRVDDDGITMVTLDAPVTRHLLRFTAFSKDEAATTKETSLTINCRR